MSRTGGPAALRTHHPVASRHPSSTRRGVCCVDLALLVEEGRTRQCRGQVVLRRLEPTTPSLRATPPRGGGECVRLCPPRGGGQDATMSRTGGPAASNPHHPVASRHPSSTRRGMCSALPSSWRRAGRDNVADRWSRGASTTPFAGRLPRAGAQQLVHEPLVLLVARHDVVVGVIAVA